MRTITFWWGVGGYQNLMVDMMSLVTGDKKDKD